MDWHQVALLTFQALIVGLSGFIGSWQLHQTSPWLNHVMAGAGVAVFWLMGKLQLSPLPHGLALPKPPDQTTR